MKKWAWTLLVGAALITGCGGGSNGDGSSDEDQIRSTVEQFYADLAEGDADGACATGSEKTDVLTEEGYDRLTGDAFNGMSCDEALSGADQLRIEGVGSLSETLGGLTEEKLTSVKEDGVNAQVSTSTGYYLSLEKEGGVWRVADPGLTATLVEVNTTPAPPIAKAKTTVEQLLRDIRAGDGAAACDLMTDDGRQLYEGYQGKTGASVTPCDRAIVATVYNTFPYEASAPTVSPDGQTVAFDVFNDSQESHTAVVLQPSEGHWRVAFFGAQDDTATEDALDDVESGDFGDPDDYLPE